MTKLAAIRGLIAVGLGAVAAGKAAPNPTWTKRDAIDEAFTRAAALLVILGFLLSAMSTSAQDAADRFRYNKELGKCVNARGEAGFNHPLPGRSRVSRESECVDFSGRILVYVSAEGGNFRGANFEGARFLYLNNMIGADLTGARLRGIEGDMIELTGANLSGADLSGALLRPCPPPAINGGACLAGARFDLRTVLPFSRDEALARGMVPVDGP